MIQISLEFVLKCPIDKKSALARVMAWCQRGDKELSELMKARFTEADMHHFASMS